MAINWKVSKTKSMGNGTLSGPKDPTRVQLLGGQLLLFRYTQNGFAPNLIISAHGRECDSPAEFPLLNGEKLHFYSHHGRKAPSRSILYAAGIHNDGEGVMNPAETVSAPASTHNYFLLKYQGVNSNGTESYDSVQKMQDRTQTKHSIIIKGKSKDDDPNKRFMLKRVGNSDLIEFHHGEHELPLIRDDKTFDILTIRNRWYGREVTLQKVMEAVRKLGHTYTDIYCSFCRGSK